MRSQKKPESYLQEKIRDFLKLRDWAVFNTHGTMYSSGLPDIYCMHTRYGTRWIEVKMPENYSFTPAQLDVFPMFSAKGVGIWILTAAIEEQYKLLFKPANWHTFLSIMKQGNFS
ncbi:hypothetical protein LCGC14_1748030 [marine sediment metagenome]|uniref:VRR-NUC domain-containing protein n=1 Tax=marine sediment metagenome TaxID=412755 RepID=A0A0F9H4Q3_9ZZZZ